jgi:hypothetical protein
MKCIQSVNILYKSLQFLTFLLLKSQISIALQKRGKHNWSVLKSPLRVMMYSVSENELIERKLDHDI